MKLYLTEVMNKHKVKACKSTTFPLEFFGGECENGGRWARTLFREYNLQRLQSKQKESTEEEQMMQQQRMAVMNDLIRKIRSTGRMDAENRSWVAEILATGCGKRMDSRKMGRCHAEMARMAIKMRRK